MEEFVQYYAEVKENLIPKGCMLYNSLYVKMENS